MWISLLAGVTLLLAQETAPAGGVAQIKFHLAEPRGLSSLRVTAEFDEAQIDGIESFTVMSAAGDAHSFAEIHGGRIDVLIRATSSTIGLLPEQPALVVSVRVKDDVPVGSILAVKVSSDTAEVTPGRVTVGGSMYVASLTRVGNRVEVRGAGFTPAVRAEWQHVAVAEVEYVSPELIRLHADGELRGKRLRLRAGDEMADVYFAYPAVKVGEGEWVTLPQTRVASGHEQFTSPLQLGGFVLRNPHEKAVEARVVLLDLVWTWREAMRVRLEPGESAYVDRGATTVNSHMILLSEEPLEAVKYSNSRRIGSPVVSKGTMELYDTDVRYKLSLARGLLEWDWASGQPLPQKQVYTWRYERGTVPPAPEMTGRPENAAPWLTFTQPVLVEPRVVSMEVSVDPRGVAAGVHRARILLDPREQGHGWFTEQGWVDVVMRVTVSPRLTTSTVALTVPGSSARVALPSTGSLSSSVFSYSEPWLKVEPESGLVIALPTGLRKGTYVSQWLVRGAGFEHLTNAVLLQDGGGPMGAGSPVELRVEEGGGFFSHVRVVSLPFSQIPEVRSFTGNGGAWLRATAVSGGVMLFVNSGGLRAGLYGGMVSVELPGVPVQQIPVALAVGPVFTLRRVPSRITMRGCERSTVLLDGGGAAMQVVREEPAGWLRATAREDGMGYEFRARECGLAPGMYRAEVQFRAGEDTVRTEIVLTMEEALPATGLPRIAALQRVDGDLLIHGGGFRRGEADVARVLLSGRRAEVLESTDYLLRVAVPEEPLNKVRIELGAWFDEWRLHVD
ncbi:MAG: hypothetical protein JNL62_23030 [Bryobacterales bacterium]|nr:hypothetical protein [Bryobacterales bacterium]